MTLDALPLNYAREKNSLHVTNVTDEVYLTGSIPGKSSATKNHTFERRGSGGSSIGCNALILRAAQPHLETRAEEVLSALTHALGVLLSLAAIAVLVSFASLFGDARRIVTVSIFGGCLLLVYLASALYHASSSRRARHWLRVIDHIAIYFLIAGTYTPFLLVNLRGGWGWSLFGVLWGLAAVGALFKVHFVHRYEIVSTIVYLTMGWIGLIAAKPFLATLPGGAIAWILAGGLAYTAGVLFFLWDHLPFNHAIWHLFVMAGSACHFFAVLWYVIPA